MANEKYFLQMSECQWPDHVFISDAKTFRLCMYHKDPSKKAASLYCVTNDQDPYPVSIELLNNKGRVIRESKGCSNRYKKKLWTIISASTDFQIKHSYCEFSIKFESLPPHYDQPLRFRFKSKSTNPKIPKIEPFTTREFRVVRYQLRILEEPPGVFYKDDGGMRNNHMTLRVALMAPLPGEGGRITQQPSKHKLNVPLTCTLMTEDGKEITGAMTKKGHQAPDHDEKHNGYSHQSNGRRSKQKARPPLHYLQLHEDCLTPTITSSDGECVIKFRINDVSQNHKNQGFHVIIRPDIETSPHLCEVYECRSSKIMVKSKSPEKLNAQGSSKKRRSTRTRAKRKASTRHSVYSDDDNTANGYHHNTRSRTRKRRSKSKRGRRGQSDDEDYKPELTDNSDLELDLVPNDHHHHHGHLSRPHIKREHDVYNHLRKRRKLNGSQYLKTNGSPCDLVEPKTFDTAPTVHWFPSMPSHSTKDGGGGRRGDGKGENGDDIGTGPEAEVQRFAQNCFEMLQFREWICIGHRTKYIERDDDESEGSQCESLKIVRCLLCDAEGTWNGHKAPRHKKGCNFVKLKRSFYAMQPHFIKLPKATNRKNAMSASCAASASSSNGPNLTGTGSNPLTSSSSNANATNHRVPLPFSGQNGASLGASTREHSNHSASMIAPKMTHLPPLPQQHSRLMAPVFPPPFFAPMHGIFPVQPSYHVLSNQPPPLIQASSSQSASTEVKHSAKLGVGSKVSTDKLDGNAMGNTLSTKGRNTVKNGKNVTKIKTQDVNMAVSHSGHQRTNDSDPMGKDDDTNNRKTSPLMFPFGHHSPSMFPANVGPMHSPLFSSNLQTPQMFNAPLSGTNGSNMFLPTANPNGHSQSHFHSMSSFGHTASTLPMPLQLPSQCMATSNGTTKSNGDCNDLNDNKNGNGTLNNSRHGPHNPNSGTTHQQHGRHGSPSPQSRAQSINPPVSTITAMSGISQDRNINSDPVDRPHDDDSNVLSHENTMSSVAATAGDGMTCNSNPMSSTLLDQLPPFHSSPTGALRNKSERRQAVPTSVSVDSAILSQSASLSAVATAGGLTVNSAPAANSKSATNSPRPPQPAPDGNGVDATSQSQMIAAHAPPPLLPQYSYLLRPQSGNGTMPALHPDTNTDSSPSPTSRGNDGAKPPPLQPLHERRLMENAPTTLTIPSVTSNSATSLLLNN